MNTTRILSYIAVSIIAANTYLTTVPEVPRFVVIAMGLASVLAVIAREELKPQQVKDIEKKNIMVKAESMEPNTENK